MKVSKTLTGTLATLAILGCPGEMRGGERTIRIEEALRMALEHDESITIQREALVASEASVEGAAGAYDPELSAEAAWREARTPANSAFSGAPAGRLAPRNRTTEATLGIAQLLPTGGVVGVTATGDRGSTDGRFEPLSPAYQTRFGLELRQPLLRNRAIDAARAGLRVAASDRAGASADLRTTLTATVAGVESVYWTLVAARREIAVREEAVRLAEEQLAETQVRIETGTAPETEIAQPRAELERRQGELYAAREAAIRAESGLKQLILGDGEPELWTEHFVPVESLEVAARPVDLAAAMGRALEARPELEAFAAELERRRVESALARDAVRPSLDAVVAYDRYGLAGDANPAASSDPIPAALRGGLNDSLDGLASGDFSDTKVGLLLSLPLGNRSARAGASVAASAERQAAAAFARARKAIRAEVLDAAAALETAGQRIAAARSAREAAEVQLESERIRYGSGLSTNFLVLTRQNDLSRARLDEIAAQTDYRRADTDLARATGTLLADRGVDVSADRAPEAR